MLHLKPLLWSALAVNFALSSEIIYARKAGEIVVVSAKSSSSEDSATEATQSTTNKIIITAAGGSGHLQAAKRVQEDLDKRKQSYVTENVIENGYIKFGINFGLRTVKLWNRIQAQGEIAALQFLTSSQGSIEVLFGNRFYFKTLKLIAANPNIDEVVDTQPLNSDQILRAVADFNKITHDKKKVKKFNKWHNSRMLLPRHRVKLHYNADTAKVVHYRKVLTDLPTPQLKTFWRSLARIPAEHVPLLTLVTPLIANDLDGKATTEFYRKQLPNLFTGNLEVGNSEQKVLQFSYGPIREGFLEKIEMPQGMQKADLPLGVQVANEAEFHDLVVAAGFEDRALNLDKNVFPLAFSEKDEVHSIMLGSQVIEHQLMAYIDSEVDFFKNYIKDRETYVFLFTGAQKAPNSLFKKVCAKIATLRAQGQLPRALHFVPVTFQNDKMISHLYSIADMILTKSGGQSCMEIEATSKGIVLVHTNLGNYTAMLPIWKQKQQKRDKKNRKLDAELFDGMPGWEGANALHMLQSLKYEDGSTRVHVVTPESFSDKLGAAQKQQTQLKPLRQLPTLARGVL